MGNKKATKSTTKTNHNHSNEANDYGSFKIVLFYCSLIVFLPVATFFFLNTLVLNNFFTLSEVKSNIYSAVGAIVSLHLALGLYIYRAYFSSAMETNNKID